VEASTVVAVVELQLTAPVVEYTKLPAALGETVALSTPVPIGALTCCVFVLGLHVVTVPSWPTLMAPEEALEDCKFALLREVTVKE